MVTETKSPFRAGSKTDNNGSALCLMEMTCGHVSAMRSCLVLGEDVYLAGGLRTSGTLSTFFATKLLSLLPWYLLRWTENSESTAREGCTLTITSLAWYATRETGRRIWC